MNNNYNDILLIDIENICYGSNYSFYNVFNRFNIKTVGQVLNNELMFNVLIHVKDDDIKRRIKGFISLLKFKYQGISMAEDVLLDRDVNDEFYSDTNFADVFNRFGFNEKQKMQILSAISFEKNKKLIDIFMEFINNGYFDNKDNKLINITNKEFFLIKSIMEMYVSSYNKSNKVVKESELKNLKSLKDQLQKLVQTKNETEREIRDMKNRLNVLIRIRDNAKNNIEILQDAINETKGKSGGIK